MLADSLSKSMRILSLYERLCQGEVIQRQTLAEEFGVDPKTISRDLNEIQQYLDQNHQGVPGGTITYDRSLGGHILMKDVSFWLTKEQVLILAKVFLESRALPKEEMDQLLDKLVLHCDPDSRKLVKNIIANERFHYKAVGHNQPLLDKIWGLSNAIFQQKITAINYQREGEEQPTTRIVEPLAIIFSEFYFYLLAGIKGKDYDFPTVFRIDRINDYQVTADNFKVVYAQRFEEGIFRKQVQFMQTGKLFKVRFKYWGTSLQAILDRLPNARIVSQEEDSYIIEAETFGRGILMWLLSQGPYVEVLAPEDFRNQMIANIIQMKEIYT